MNKIQYAIQSRSPAILTAAGIGGFIFAIVWTARIAPKAQKILDEMPEATLKDKVVAVAPLYSPIAAGVMVSTGAILAGTHILNRRYGAALALYSATESALARWQQTTLSELGQKRFDQVRQEVVRPTEPIPPTPADKEGMVLFWDDWTAKYFWARSVEEIKRAVNNVNATANREDFCSLNDYYYELGLPPVPYGNLHGWGWEGHLLEVAFDPIMTENDRTAISVSFVVPPRMDHWGV